MNIKHLIAAAAALAASTAFAAPVTYDIEPNHTYPSFEADHMGISVWRGKFTKTDGTIVLDRAAKTGSVDITVDMNSVDFGHEKMNAHARKPDIFDVAQFPTATFKGNKLRFEGENPEALERIFDLFVQETSSRAPNESGLGIGLSDDVIEDGPDGHDGGTKIESRHEDGYEGKDLCASGWSCDHRRQLYPGNRNGLAIYVMPGSGQAGQLTRRVRTRRSVRMC